MAFAVRVVQLLYQRLLHVLETVLMRVTIRPNYLPLMFCEVHVVPAT